MTDAADWTGRVGDMWAAEWHRTDRSLADLSRHLDAAILAVAPATGHALDIGCGAGATSLALAAARPGLSVTGIDLSEGLIAAARKRAGECRNLSFHVADASDPNAALAPARHAGPVRASTVRQGTPTESRFDLLVSRHGVMFFADPVAGFTALRCCATPGARLVFSCFRPIADNPWATDLVTALTGQTPAAPTDYAPGPFALAECARTATILAAAGWHDAKPQPIDFTYQAGGGADPLADALDFFTRIGPAAPILAAAPPADRPALLDRLRAVLTPRATTDRVTFAAAAWIWTATAGEHAS